MIWTDLLRIDQKAVKPSFGSVSFIFRRQELSKNTEGSV